MHPVTITAADQIIAIDFDGSVSPDAAAAVGEAFSHLASSGVAEQRITASMSADAEVPADGAFARGATVPRLIRSIADAVDGLVMAAFVPDTSQGRADELPPLVALNATSLNTSEGAVVIFGGHSRQRAITAMRGAASLIGGDVTVIHRRDRGVSGVTGLVNTGGPTTDSARWEKPQAAGVTVFVGSSKVRAFVFLSEAEDGEPEWFPVSTPEAVAMASGAVPSSSVVVRPLLGLASLFEMAPAAVVIRYRQEAQIPALIAEVLERPGDKRQVQPADVRAVEGGATPRIGDVRRAAMRDAITDGKYMAFCTSQYSVLAVGGIAPLLWDFAEDWASVEALSSRLVDAIGAPDGDVREHVASAVNALVAQGVLVQV